MKTSGPDRRVETLQVRISPDAYFLEPFWLRFLGGGGGLWEAQGLNRDYFVTPPGANFANHAFGAVLRGSLGALPPGVDGGTGLPLPAVPQHSQSGMCMVRA